MSLSKSKILFINSLKQKKCRDESRSFLAEGNKIVLELLSSDYSVNQIFAPADWLTKNEKKLKKVSEVFECSGSDLERISLQKTPDGVLAIASQKKNNIVKEQYINDLSLVLDTIQDPGNLGTIVRAADWFGIKHIFCSTDTVDIYNPKVIQSTMGSFLRCVVEYVELPLFLSKHKQIEGFDVYGAFLNGKNIYSEELSPKGFLVMGNEGNGISPKIEKYISQRISIPSFASGNGGSESLNVAIATAVICSEFRRRTI